VGVGVGVAGVLGANKEAQFLGPGLAASVAPVGGKGESEEGAATPSCCESVLGFCSCVVIAFAVGERGGRCCCPSCWTGWLADCCDCCG
jgi:hypothetical protein